ncbi:MFS transporter [Lentzea tibetensis]|uniref:MFS transporter n=1 Tax=Lentzea tibetensis TaxID=2591470 RepID=A0A563EGE8_9PSEU|nr:MFS transporter [Lentzea tibetensis]TWP44789.1 MFS transporter [Lentzea tibetensis]
MNPRRLAEGRLARAGLYAGGFLGPFGGAMTSSILPEIGADFDRSAGEAAATLSYYLLPFAGLLLVSGTLAQRWGPQRTVRGAYVVYAAASILCAVSWAFPVLIGLRAVQGAANAFVTPVLLGALAAIVPKERLGRTLGLFASMQAAGQTSAPLVSGLVAEASWRWAFVGAAAVATALAVLGVPRTEAAEKRPSLRSAFVPTTLRAALVAFVGWGCLGGLGFLVAFRLDDAFGLGASQRGVLLTGFGVAGFLAARFVGRAVDRFGARTCVLGATFAGAGLLVAIGTAPSLVAVGLCWALTGACSQGVLVSLNTLVLSTGANRGGAVSVVQSLRFLGGAVAPLAFVPLYQASTVAAFVVPAAALVLVPPAVLQREKPGQHVEAGLDVEQTGETERNDGR